MKSSHTAGKLGVGAAGEHWLKGCRESHEPKKKEEERSILEDLSFCDLMDDVCTEG